MHDTLTRPQIAPHIAIAARNVTLSLGEAGHQTQILKGIDLEIPLGQSVALLEPSGSGKSSLMAILSGLERASSGEVRVAGLDFGPMDEDGLARARRGRIGIVLQAFHLLPTMTALENVAVPLELAGIADPFGTAQRELEAVGLGHRVTHYPSQLSGGEQQRVAVARALANRPRVVLADEPTGNLDEATADKVFDEFLHLVREEGSAALVATHNERLATRMDRVVRLHDGRIA